MLTSKSFLAVDFGAATLKLAEFEVNEAGALRLKKYGFATLGQEGLQDTSRPAALQQKLQALLAEKQFSANRINVCAPGFQTFSKFVRLPPVDTSKVTQIIQYEAQQNVPFPLEEVVWDYQITGTTPTGELEVLLVAIKNDVVEGLFRVSESAGLRLQLADVSPAALCNAFRYNYGDVEGCSMLLDIGAKTCNLLFFDKGQVYSRGINIGANSITADFAREAKISYEEAERLKIEEGFVGLGGAYAEPENPNQAAISKIARQFMTRLHIQVNQTIQFYRSQQGGAAPQQLFLSGGASVMHYTREFFTEKFNIPVEYFNPLRSVEIDPSIDLDELVKVAHSMGETVGLGLRNLAHCPVELNLMPESSLSRQRFAQKKPYFIASVLGLALIVFAIGFFFERVSKQKSDTLNNLQAQLKPMESLQAQLKRAEDGVKKVQTQADSHLQSIDQRFYWSRMLSEVRSAFRETEEKAADILQSGNVEAGLWIEQLSPSVANVQMEGVTAPTEESPDAAAPTAAPKRGGRRAAAAATADASGGRQVSTILLSCRGVNLNQTVKPSANFELASALAQKLAAKSNYFTTNTALSGRLEVDDKGTNANFFFTFELTLKLAKPLEL